MVKLPRFTENALKLVAGRVLSQGISVLVAPIVVRLFAPEIFGVAALFTAISGVIGVVVCLGYDRSILLPKTNEEASNLLGLSLFFVLIITGISVLSIFFAGDAIAKLLNSQELRQYFWLLPVSVFVNGIFLVLNYWSSRTKHFGRLSVVGVISSVVSQGTKLGAGFAGIVSGGALIGATILGRTISTFVLGVQIWRDNRYLFKANIRWKKMIAGLKRHKKFPIYNTWSALLNIAAQQIPAVMLSFYFSPKVVGFYALGLMVLNTPMRLVGQAIAQIFFQKISDEHNRTGNLSEVVEEVFKRLVSFGIFPILLLSIIGKDVFIVAFGARWGEAGCYVQILGIWIFFAFIFSPISTLYIVLEKQWYGLVFNAVLFIVRAISLICGGLMGDVRIALIFFSGTSAIVYLFMTLWLLLCVNISLFNVAKIFLKNTVLCIPALSIVALCKFCFDLTPLRLVLIGIIVSLPYYFILVTQDRELQKPISLLRRKFGFLK